NLPRSGYRKWQPYFDRAFAVFTELWRFQQQYRESLSEQQVLKRHHIGEIASKIGQLYYQYYLRTSNTAYLTETYCFYYAIRCRGYYDNAKTEKRPDFMVKKLRYLCRFILVCLVLENGKLAAELMQDLSRDIADYEATYQPFDAAWWFRVADEIRSMLRAAQPLSLLDSDGRQLFLKRRLSPETSPPLTDFLALRAPTGGTTQLPLRLADALIVGGCADQAKFSELSVDMLRMSLALEKQPPVAAGAGGGPAGLGDNPGSRQVRDRHLRNGRMSEGIAKVGGMSEGIAKVGRMSEGIATVGRMSEGIEAVGRMSEGIVKPGRMSEGIEASGRPHPALQGAQSPDGGLSESQNPHKYLLYRPSLAEIVFSLNSTFNDLPDDGVVLVYFSADGRRCQQRGKKEDSAFSSQQQNLQQVQKDATTQRNIDAMRRKAQELLTEAASAEQELRQRRGPAPAAKKSRLSTYSGYRDGGLAVQRSRESDKPGKPETRRLPGSGGVIRDSRCFYPGDMYCFTRKPVFLIVDSDNSTAFKKFPNLFNEPLVCLMSPEQIPSSVCPGKTAA
uniref:Protein SCAI n=1 Tax=Macrostomum lignano TaxID=282301 RepID=A0A1I8IJP6_9PLAT